MTQKARAARYIRKRVITGVPRPQKCHLNVERFQEHSVRVLHFCSIVRTFQIWAVITQMGESNDTVIKKDNFSSGRCYHALDPM